jgi:hypothetical protein
MLYTRSERQRGHLSFYHVNGDEHQLGDLGTKNVPASEAAPKLAIIEVDPPR